AILLRFPEDIEPLLLVKLPFVSAHKTLKLMSKFDLTKSVQLFRVLSQKHTKSICFHIIYDSNYML
ncbi:MAG: hypothetical protein V1775_00715, partial [Bacteroidota bacterium]